MSKKKVLDTIPRLKKKRGIVSNNFFLKKKRGIVSNNFFFFLRGIVFLSLWEG